MLFDNLSSDDEKKPRISPRSPTSQSMGPRGIQGLGSVSVERIGLLFWWIEEERTNRVYAIKTALVQSVSWLGPVCLPISFTFFGAFVPFGGGGSLTTF
jgi:hypothetical protein